MSWLDVLPFHNTDDPKKCNTWQLDLLPSNIEDLCILNATRNNLANKLKARGLKFPLYNEVDYTVSSTANITLHSSVLPLSNWWSKTLNAGMLSKKPSRYLSRTKNWYQHWQMGRGNDDLASFLYLRHWKTSNCAALLWSWQRLNSMQNAICWTRLQLLNCALW
jgi:hypothetical protein